MIERGPAFARPSGSLPKIFQHGQRFSMVAIDHVKIMSALSSGLNNLTQSRACFVAAVIDISDTLLVPGDRLLQLPDLCSGS